MNASILTRVLVERWKLRRQERWARQDLEAHQAAALRALREFAYASSAFYRRLHRGLTTRPLHELPIVTKAQLMESFDEVVTTDAVRLENVKRHLAKSDVHARLHDRYRVASTSGSTGRRGLFVWDRDEWATVLASYARANSWAGLEVGLTRRMKLGIVSSRVPSHQSAVVGATLDSRLIPTLRLDASAPLADIVRALNEFGPENLVAYASMARVLAEEQIAGRLRIAPRAVMSASEVLNAESRDKIERAWGVRPFDVYAATETAGIASECAEHRGMHLYEDLVITEVVDAQNRPVPPGITGAKVLVTVLFSRTQPLIRYEMTDRVRLSEHACRCGRPFALLDSVEGRLEDVLDVPSLRGGSMALDPSVFQKLIDVIPSSGWQVVQEPERLRVLVAGSPSVLDVRGLASMIESALLSRGMAVHVHVERVDEIPRSANGKTPLVVRR